MKLYTANTLGGRFDPADFARTHTGNMDPEAAAQMVHDALALAQPALAEEVTLVGQALGRPSFTLPAGETAAAA